MNEKEKAIAYDKALERANKLQETCDNSTIVGWMEYIFPELVESKDERIKKAIIRILKGEDTYTSNENTEEYVAWLEKQKDTNVLIQEASEKAYTEGMRVEREHWLEKQGQVKESSISQHEIETCKGK